MNLNAMNDPTLSLADTCSQGSPGLGPSVLSGAGESGDTQQAEISSSCLLWTWPAPGVEKTDLELGPMNAGEEDSWRYSEAWSGKGPVNRQVLSPRLQEQRAGIHVQTLPFVSFPIRSEKNCSLPGFHFCHRMIPRLLWILRNTTKRWRSAGSRAPPSPAASGTQAAA